MIQLESLKIQNFRCFNNLEMNGFSKINVLLGENNSGKTSVLESIFLLSGMSNPQLALTINLMRKISFDKNTFKYIFHNLELTNRPSISGSFSKNINRKMEISPILEKNIVSREVETSTQGNSLSTTSLSAVPDILGLDFSFTIKKMHEPNKSFKTWLRLEQGGIRQELSSTYKEDIVSSFLLSVDTDNGLLDRLKKIFVAKKENVLNDLLNKFDNRIKGLYVLSNGIYIDQEGVSERIPIQLMGDGIRRFISIAATIVANSEQNFICLIDEIENGLHFKSQELMWKTLLTLTNSANVQLFITTHSLEMLQSLTNVLKESKYTDMQDSIKVFSIVNTVNDGFQSYVRSFEGLDLSLENSMEIR